MTLLLEVIGVNGNRIESLMEHGVCRCKDALGVVDIESVLDGLLERTKVIAIRRLKGCDQRPSIPLDEIEKVITRLKNVHP